MDWVLTRENYKIVTNFTDVIIVWEFHFKNSSYFRAHFEGFQRQSHDVWRTKCAGRWEKQMKQEAENVANY